MAAQRAIKKMFKPRKPRRDEDPNGLYWEDTPELRALLYKYAKQDMATMRELHQRLAPLPETEREVAVIDAEINDKGVLIDAPLAAAASRLAGRALADLDARIKKNDQRRSDDGIASGEAEDVAGVARCEAAA